MSLISRISGYFSPPSCNVHLLQRVRTSGSTAPERFHASRERMVCAGTDRCLDWMTKPTGRLPACGGRVPRCGTRADCPCLRAARIDRICCVSKNGMYSSTCSPRPYSADASTRRTIHLVVSRLTAGRALDGRALADFALFVAPAGFALFVARAGGALGGGGGTPVTPVSSALSLSYIEGRVSRPSRGSSAEPDSLGGNGGRSREVPVLVRCQR